MLLGNCRGFIIQQLKLGVMSALMVPLALGCFSSGPKPYGITETEAVSVQGVITLDDKPVPNANVTFTFDGAGPKGFVSSGGMTDSSGKYQLRSGKTLGTPPGRYKVTINRWAKADGSTFTPNPEKGLDLEQAKMSGDVKEFMPPKFSDLEQTELTVEVTKDQKDPVNFNLKSQ